MRGTEILQVTFGNGNRLFFYGDLVAAGAGPFECGIVFPLPPDRLWPGYVPVMRPWHDNRQPTLDLIPLDDLMNLGATF